MRDYSGPRPFFWRLLSTWAVSREIRALSLLDGLTGIPRLVSRLNRSQYLIEYVEGKTLNYRIHHPGPEFFESLSDIIMKMHYRGVAHGDLRNKNILVGLDGQPYLIDFTTAWRRTSRWRIPLFKFYTHLDRRRLAVSKAKFLPESLSEGERALLEGRPFYIRIGHFFRRRVYPMISRHSRERSETRRRDLEKGTKKEV
jgi:serine/threonine protein kinase